MIREAIEKGSISKNQKAFYKLEIGAEFPSDADDAIKFIDIRIQHLEDYVRTHDK